jgi:hypothetical protein
MQNGSPIRNRTEIPSLGNLCSIHLSYGAIGTPGRSRTYIAPFGAQIRSLLPHPIRATSASLPYNYRAPWEKGKPLTKNNQPHQDDYDKCYKFIIVVHSLTYLPIRYSVFLTIFRFFWLWNWQKHVFQVFFL